MNMIKIILIRFLQKNSEISIMVRHGDPWWRHPVSSLL